MTIAYSLLLVKPHEEVSTMVCGKPFTFFYIKDRGLNKKRVKFESVRRSTSYSLDVVAS
jgi:hypothetical protein